MFGLEPVPRADDRRASSENDNAEKLIQPNDMRTNFPMTIFLLVICF